MKHLNQLLSYSHNRAGKGASLGLAVPDEECPIPPSFQQLLRLFASHSTNIPGPLLLVGIVFQGVWAFVQTDSFSILVYLMSSDSL